MNTSRSDMIQAVLEGVAFAICDNFEVATSLGIRIERSKLCGGGSISELWRKVIYNVLNIPLDIPTTEEGPAYRGAMLAMAGCCQYADVMTCAQALVTTKETITSDQEIASLDEVQYCKFQTLYLTLRNIFPQPK